MVAIVIAMIFVIPIICILLLIWESKRIKPFRRIKKDEEDKYYNVRRKK